MRRLKSTPRPEWRKIVESQGLLWHTNSEPYWNEAACYELTASEVDRIEAATGELHGLYLQGAQHVINHQRYAEFGIPPGFPELIEQAWEAEPPSLYGRFDLAWTEADEIKLLEYNADTPTSLLEAAVIQWYWLEASRGAHPGRDQFNSIHEKLVALWREFRPYLADYHIHFTSADDVEDGYTVAYLEDTAQQAGYTTSAFAIDELGYHAGAGEFRDPGERPVRTLFKLYPWEWLANEEGSDFFRADRGRTICIEPVWKMLWSNKAMLAILWELFPGHPLLLPAMLGQAPAGVHDFVKKPILGREGSNLTIFERDAAVESTGGDYGEEGFVYQALARAAPFDGRYAVLGSWTIGHEDNLAAGVGIRESGSRITGNTSSFVPHFFLK